MKNVSHKKHQGGFTLIELVVVIAILFSLASLSGIFSFSGDKSKAANLLQSARLYSDGLLRITNDTGATPRNPHSLFLKASNAVANNFEGINAVPAWRGPYVNGFSADTNGDAKLDNLGSGAIMKIGQVTTGLPTGMTTGYQLDFTGLTDDVVKEAVANCNSTDISTALPTTFAAGNKCKGALKTATVPANLQFLYTMQP